MNTSKRRILTSLVIAMAIGLTFGTGSANAAVIYYDDFGGSSGDNLNGTTPDTVSGDFGTSGASWNASTNFKADGSVPSSSGSSALLPFEPEAGWSYTLTVPYFNDSNAWYSMGFANGSATTSQTSQDNGLAHFISRGESHNQYHVMAGVGFNESLNSGSLDGGVSHEYVLTLDATDGLDKVKVSASIDGTSVLTESVVNYTSSGKGEIKYVQLSEGKAGGYYDSLTLTAIPEPASLGLFGIVCGALWFVRRKFRGIAS